MRLIKILLFFFIATFIATLYLNADEVVFEDNFNSGLSSDWRALKAEGGFTPKVPNNKRLRLTNRHHDLSTAVTLDYEFPTLNNKFVLEFDYYTYGGCSDGDNYVSGNAGKWGADGMSIILFDSSVGMSPTVGASGGSLGYSSGYIEMTDGTHEYQPGFQGGWLGIGLDEFGSFVVNDEGRKDINGTTLSNNDLEDNEQPNTIAIRGMASNGYRLLKTTASLSESIARESVNDDGTLKGNADSSYYSGKYRLTVDSTSANHLYIKLERKKGSLWGGDWHTVINQFDAMEPQYHQGAKPAKFRLAFSSGTGGGCNKHEIDNIKIYGQGEEYTQEPKVSIADANITEGDSGTKHLNFTVTLDRPAPNGGVTVQVQPHNITANEGEDYTRNASSIYFAEGESSKTIYYVINGDTKVEGDETFKVELHNPQNAILGRSEAIGTILNDDSNSGDCEETLLSLDIPVINTNDDAEERKSNGHMYRDSSDLEMTQESHEQIVGIRFQNVNIPKNATITNAYIQFSVDETSSQATNLTIYGEATDNANSYSSSYHNISNRSKTISSTSWSPPAWSSTHQQGVNQRTPNLKDIVQEIVNRNGWSSGNAMSFIITGTGKRVAESYDGESDEAPRLHIEYMGCPTENNSTNTATCYALTDNSDKLYKVTMSPNATPLPVASYVNINKTFNGEGSAYRASNNKFYAFKGVSDDYGPSDLYTVDVDTGVTTKIVDNIISGAVDGAEFYFNPTLNKEILYVISGEHNSKLYAFDPDSWSLLAGYPKNTHTDLSSLAIDPTNGEAYAIDDYNYDNKKPKVYKLNLETGATTHITTLQHLADAEGLAFASDGNLYIEDEGRDDLSGKKLYKVNLQTGELTPSAITNSNGDIEGLSCNGTQMAIDNPTLSLDGNHSILEGDVNTTDFIFPITLSKPATDDIVLKYEIIDINTTANEDYILDSNLSILIPKDTNSSSIVIKVKGDRDVEGDESFYLKLVDATNAIVNSSSVVGTIIDDEVAEEPFICNETLYLSNRSELGTGNSDSGATWLHSFYATGATYAPIGDGYISSDGGYNAIGYNVQDNFIYALYGNHLLKIDRDANVKDLGVVTDLPNTQLYAGEFDRDGYYYVSGNGSADNKMYKIDIEQKKVVATITLSQSVRFWDMAIDTTGEYFYAMLIENDKNYKFAKIKISDGTITTIGDSHSDLPSYISLIFSDAEGKVVALSQDGKLYEIMPQSGKVYFTRPFEPLTFYNDGTSCPDANITLPPHPPRLSINDVSQLEGDANTTTIFNFTVTADKPFDMSPMSGAIFYYRVVDGDGDEVVPPHEVALSSDHDFEAQDGIGIGMSMFSNGVSINIPVTVYGDNKVERDEEFYVEIYSPQLPPMMNPKYIIDKNIGIGTIINDDNIFNIERVNSDIEENQTQAQKESLYTQIAGKDFDYSIVSYFGPDTNIEYDVKNILFNIELIDMNTTDENRTLYTKYYYADELKKRFPIIDSHDLKIQRATREAKFKISYILDVNSTKIDEYNTLKDAYDTLKNNSSFKRGTSYSRDSFAIRPANFLVSIKDIDENNQSITYITNYDSIDLSLVADYQYIIESNATIYGTNQATQAYSTNDLNSTLIFNTKGNCNDDSNRSLDYLFNNGQLSNKFFNNNVGKYRLHIEDIYWTDIDKNEENLGCIVGSSSNKLVNGKYGCNIASDINMSFQPYKFEFANTTLSNINGNGKDYVYMSDLSRSTEMGVKLSSTIKALGKEGTVLSNFTNSCIEGNPNLKVKLKFDFEDDRGKWSNSNMTYPKSADGKDILMPQQIVAFNDNNISKSNVTIIKDINIKKKEFKDENNGTMSIDIIYNMQKLFDKPTNPIKVDFIALDLNSTGLEGKLEGEENTPIGVGDINKTKIFYFARVASVENRYIEIVGKKDNTAEIEIEIFCRTNTLNQDWCRDDMNIANITSFIPSKSYSGWFLAKEHNSTTDGTIYSFQAHPSSGVTISYPEPIKFINGKYGKIKTLSSGNNYSIDIELIGDDWLKYTTKTYINSYYNILLKEKASLGGVGKTGHILDTKFKQKPFDHDSHYNFEKEKVSW